MKTSFKPFPVLETENLILRKLQETDAFDLFEIRSNPEMYDFIDGKADEVLDDTIRFIKLTNKGIDKQKWIHFGIEYKHNKKLIGTINLWNFDYSVSKAEGGFSLNPSYQRKGLMVEALKKVIDYGFYDMDLEKIELWTEKNNERTINLANKCKFCYKEQVFEKGYYKNKIFNYVIYELKKM